MITASPEVLERTARKLEQTAGNIECERQRLETASSTIESAWQSRFTPEFCYSVNKTEQSVYDCAEQVRAIARMLRTTAAEVRRVERLIASSSGN